MYLIYSKRACVGSYISVMLLLLLWGSPCHAGTQIDSSTIYSSPDVNRWMRKELHISDTEITNFIESERKFNELERDFRNKLKPLIRQNNDPNISIADNAHITKQIINLIDLYSDSKRIYRKQVESNYNRLISLQKSMIAAHKPLSMYMGSEVLNDIYSRSLEQSTLDALVSSHSPSLYDFIIMACYYVTVIFVVISVITFCIILLLCKFFSIFKYSSTRKLIVTSLIISLILTVAWYLPWCLPYNIFAFLTVHDEASLNEYESILNMYGINTIIVHSDSNDITIITPSGKELGKPPLGLIQTYLDYVANTDAISDLKCKIGVRVNGRFVSFRNIESLQLPILLTATTSVGGSYTAGYHNLAYSKSQSVHFYICSVNNSDTHNRIKSR